VSFLLSVIEFFFYLLRSRRSKAKCVKTRCPHDGVGQLEPRFQGEGVVPGNIFWFYKTRHILRSDSANCTVLRAVVLIQYRCVTDGRTDGQTYRRTDGIAIANTALAMRALRRAVKMLMFCMVLVFALVSTTVGICFICWIDDR